jgi:hypothetical protein
MLCGMCGASCPPGSISCPNCGAVLTPGPGAAAPAGYPQYPGQPPYANPPYPGAPYALRGLGTAVTVLLGLTALVSLAAIAILGLRILAIGLALVDTIVFIIWFFQARQNAGRLDWPQRWSPGWAIGGWFVPICFLWFPYQIMADIWRAGLPAAARAKPALLPGAWWACWCLAWFGGFEHVTRTTGAGTGFQTTTTSYSLVFDGTRLSLLFSAAAAALLAVLVTMVSNGPVGGGSVMAWQPGGGS